MEQKLVVIRSTAGLLRLKEYLKDKEYIAYDTETTGLKRGSEVIGFSVCAEEEVGYYVVLSYWDVAQQKLVYLETKDATKDFLRSLLGKKLIMQNAPFDCRMTFDNFGVELMPHVFHDTLVSGHLLNENRRNGLKERGLELFGESAKQEMIEMRASIAKNGGQLTKECYELYKADSSLIARYGAKDAILTLKVFYQDAYDLIDQKLDGFFYDDESMPLTRGPTYDMNTTGLLIDKEKLANLKGALEAECAEAATYIYEEINPYVKAKYPGTSKRTEFNVGAPQQLAWLLFENLGNEFNTLTKSGKEVCKALGLKLPYAPGAKREFIRECRQNKGNIWKEEGFDKKKGKIIKAKKVEDPWKYLSTGKVTLGRLATKYRWVEKLLEHKKADKLLKTYVIGIQERMDYYGIIRPDFKQCGTTSGRYSCSNPNFQNLPRDDKRVKACIIARPGKVFVGADYSQLEPRVFASHSGDERLLECFKNGDDFYSVVGRAIFPHTAGSSMKKDAPNAFAKLFERERQQAKVIALAAPYGQTAAKLAPELGVSMDDASDIAMEYFRAWPKVKKMQLKAHALVRRDGVVYNLFGRPRRIPKALEIDKIFGESTKHADLPYEARTLLNLAVNHEIQSTGASIMNRAAIAITTLRDQDPAWNEVKIILQVHDSLILEGPEALADKMAEVLKDAMENTTKLPGVNLEAKPMISKNLAGIK